MLATCVNYYSLDRLKALMQEAFNARGHGARGTQEYLLGWLYGLADAGAVDENTLFSAQQFVAHKDYEKAQLQGIDLYDYPDTSFSRVEGKAMRELEGEITSDTNGESRIGRIYTLVGDGKHSLHFVAKHYLFLSRAQMASVTFDD